MHFEKKEREFTLNIKPIYPRTINAIQIRILIIKERTSHLIYDLQ